MPALANGSKSLAFGDFLQGYQIVDRQGMRVLRDPYTAKPYVKFYTTKRTGGGGGQLRGDQAAQLRLISATAQTAVTNK
jgi:HK97 family phage major capsid protein